MFRITQIVAIVCLPLSMAARANANGDGSDRSGFGLGARYSHVTNRETDQGTHMGGVLARARSEFIGLEGAVDYRSENLGGGVDLKTWPVTANLLVYPLRTVYGLAGVGWYNATLDFPRGSPFRDRTDSKLGYQLGAGVEVPVGETVRLTGDFRYQFINYKFDEIPSSIGNVDADAFMVSAGLLFHLR